MQVWYTKLNWNPPHSRYLYLSVFNSTETFLHFQWDTLILETGFLCVVVAPFARHKPSPRPYDHLKMALVKWLLFRMMLASGEGRRRIEGDLA